MIFVDNGFNYQPNTHQQFVLVSSLYFQSSALPTELPGHTGWKRVLNRRAGFESSLKRVLEQIL